MLVYQRVPPIFLMKSPHSQMFGRRLLPALESRLFEWSCILWEMVIIQHDYIKGGGLTQRKTHIQLQHALLKHEGKTGNMK